MITQRITPIVLDIERQATSTDTFTVKTKPWRDGDLVEIYSVTVSNQDHSNKVAHVGVITGNDAKYYETLSLTTSGYYYHTSEAFTIPSGHRLIIKLVSPGNGDKYHINIWGKVIHCDVKG